MTTHQSIRCSKATSRRQFASYINTEVGAEVRSKFCAEEIRKNIAAQPPFEQSNRPVNHGELILSLASAAKESVKVFSDRYSDLSSQVGPVTNSCPVRSKAALELAPFFIASQHLLGSVAGSWNNEERYALASLRVHALDQCTGQPGSSRIDRYEDILRYYSIADVGSDLRHTASDTRISEGSFTLAAKLLILSNFPESLTGQILGINLYLRQCGLLPPLGFISEGLPIDQRFLDLSLDPANGMFETLIHSENAALEYLDHTNSDGVSGLVSGFYWAREQTENLMVKLHRILVKWIDPREAARQVIANRSHEACQYHDKTKINGESIVGLFTSGDTSCFLDHLAASPYVKAGDPERSPLLNGLISYRGKMFRVFSNNDVAALHRWIAGLPYESPSDSPAAHGLFQDLEPFAEVVRRRPSATHVSLNTKPRQIYSKLLHIEISSDEEAYAKHYIDRWLKRSKKGVIDGSCPLPEEWSACIIQQWVDKQHSASNHSFTEGGFEVPSRENVVADILSLAPLTMIDGAWLASCSHPSIASSSYGYRLFETYYDELGNGIHKFNHPAIYRDLLKAVHGEFPSTADPGYANSECFNDKDFELPVFWLSIGRYPNSYLPEILGLNLAMELSGVGGGYRRTRDALASYGFPTTFADIHNSIDNVATGHSAWAAAALDAYISTLAQSERSHCWARIRTGFVALNPPKEKSIFNNAIGKMKSLL